MQNVYIFPYERSPVKSYQFNDWIFETDVSVFAKHFEILVNKKTIQIDFKPGLEYSSLIHSEKFRMSLALAHANCEANIYLHPGNIERDPFIFDYHYDLEFLIKDQFWIDYYEMFEIRSWKREILSTTPKYSILICERDEKSSSCYDKRYIKHWLTAVLGEHTLVRMTELRFILQTYLSGQQLFIHCPYCDYCNSLKMIPIFKKKQENHLI